MNRLKRQIITLLLGAIAITLPGCDQEPPSRNQIPILKKRLFRLQEAVKERNRAAIDSLLSLQILEINQSSDSLLRYTYKPDGSFEFSQFAIEGIVYTRDRARIDCWIMDAARKKDRPLILTWVFEYDQWLLKKFEPGETPSPDSTGQTTTSGP